MDENICPWCGAYSTRSCEIEDEGGFCPWEESRDESPDPDRLREDRDERLRLAKEGGNA